MTKYQEDRLPFWIILGVLIVCGVLSIFSLDPFDFLIQVTSKDTARTVFVLVLIAACASWLKSTMRKVVQEETSEQLELANHRLRALHHAQIDGVLEDVDEFLKEEQAKKRQEL